MLNDVELQPGGPAAAAAGGGEGAGGGGGGAVELRPAELSAEIDAWNDKLYKGLNNGVYRCGGAVQVEFSRPTA
jgi:hypothetical protein